MTESEQKITVDFHHPHVMRVDIMGNFHRGLMLGILIGFVLGILFLVASKFLWS